MLTFLKLSDGQREPVRIKPLGSTLAQLCRRFLKKREILTRRPTAAIICMFSVFIPLAVRLWRMDSYDQITRGIMLLAELP